MTEIELTTENCFPLLIDELVKNKIFSSKTEARNMIKNEGVAFFCYEGVGPKFKLEGNKTKDMLKALTSLEINEKKVLLVMDELTEQVILASRNLANVLLMEPAEINVLDILNADVLLFDKQAIADVEEALK